MHHISPSQRRRLGEGKSFIFNFSIFNFLIVLLVFSFSPDAPLGTSERQISKQPSTRETSRKQTNS